MISEFYGLKLPIAKFRELIKVDNLGASIYGIVTGAEKIGLHTEALEGNIEELLDGINNNEFSFPFIARIINEEMFEHYVVIYAIKKRKVYIGDPAKSSIQKKSVEEFISQWQEQIIAFSPEKSFEKGNKKKGSFSKFFKYITNQKKTLALVFVASLIISGISLFSASIFEYIIDDAVTVGDINGEFAEDEHDHEDENEVTETEKLSSTESILIKVEDKLNIIFQNLETVCISIIFLYLIQAGLQMLRGYLLALMAKNIDIPVSLSYFDHMVDLPSSFFGTRKTGELMSRFSDASNIREAISTVTLTILLDTLMAILTGVYLLILNYKLFIVTLTVMLIYTVIIAMFRKTIKNINHEIMEENSQITSYLKETVDGIETIKSYGVEEKSKNKIKKLFLRFSNKVVRGSIIFNFQDVLAGLVESIGMVVILWLGAYLCVESIITVGVLITFYYLLGYFLNPVKNLIELQPTLQTAMVAAERLNDILDMEAEDNNKAEISSMNSDIQVNNIDFRYGYRELVLKNVTMNFKAGSKTAIVGETGCGKTTLVKLLMSFDKPENGSITVDGEDIGKYSPDSIRKRISYISQDIFLFSDSIYNNLRMGNEEISNDEIEKICQQCGIDDFIHSMPMGYDTVLEENGNNLSGGQKQRLAIARALLRKPDVLIMDEATSNLDTITENSIKAMIENFSDKMTCIIIAHRLNTIRNCDYIYVMDKGQVTEEGTHDELLSLNGLYSNYVNQ